MKLFLMLISVGAIALTGCVDGKTALEDKKHEQVSSMKATELSCNLLSDPPFNIPSKREMSNMANALKKCESKAPEARAVYDPGWSCYVWEISGSNANKMKKCLIENFGWKELGPPRWIENTVAAPPF